MDREYILNIAGLPLVFEGKQWQEHIRHIENRYIFCNGAAAGKNPIRIEKTEAGPLQDPSMFDKYVRHRRKTNYDSYEFFHNTARVFMFDFNRSRQCGIAHVLSAAMDSEKLFSINGRRYPDTFFNRSFDMLVYAIIIALYGGIMLHAVSMVNSRGRGIVLCGPSGIGKTTVAEKLKQRGFNIIDDDTAVIMPTKSGYRLYPLPWDRGVFRDLYRGTPLDTVALIRRASGSTSAYVPLSSSESIVELVGNIRCLKPIIKSYPRFMRTLVALTRQVNCGVLYHALGDVHLSGIEKEL